jgi:hypothetical protein
MMMKTLLTFAHMLFFIFSNDMFPHATIHKNLYFFVKAFSHYVTLRFVYQNSKNIKAINLIKLFLKQKLYTKLF